MEHWETTYDLCHKKEKKHHCYFFNYVEGMVHRHAALIAKKLSWRKFLDFRNTTHRYQ